MPSDNITTLSIENNIPMSKSIIDILTPITQNLNIYPPLISSIIGLVGFLGNLFTYLQPELRSNTCCIYSLFGSIFDIINLSFNLFPKYFNNKHGIAIPWFISSGQCKLGLFLLSFLPHLPTNFLLMAIIDRFAATCNLTSPIRRIIQAKMVPLMVAFVLLTSCLFSISTVFFHYEFYGYECQTDQPLAANILYVVQTGLMQPIIMLIFVLLTYRNIHQSRQRVRDRNDRNPVPYRTQFIIMVFGQIFITAFLTLQWIVFYMYFTFVISNIQSYEEYVILMFAFAITNTLYYLNNVKAFYISLLTSNLFRRTFIKGLKNLVPGHVRARIQISRTNTRVQTVTRNK